METRTYRVKSPDGKTIVLTGPKDATEQEVLSRAQELYSQMNTASAETEEKPSDGERAREILAKPGPAQTFMDNLVNNALFGIPEKIANMIPGVAETQQSINESNPVASKSGELAGQLMPIGGGAALGAKLMGRGFQKVAPNLPDIISNVAKRGSQVAGGVMGGQAGSGTAGLISGGPEEAVLRSAITGHIMNTPLQVIPGFGPVSSALSGIVPGIFALGGMASGR